MEEIDHESTSALDNHEWGLAVTAATLLMEFTSGLGFDLYLRFFKSGALFDRAYEIVKAGFA